MSDQPPTLPASPAPRPENNTFLTGLKEHRLYRVALGYAVGAWVVLQVAAIVLPGFGAPAWVLRALMIVLALGFGAALLAGWTYDRRVAGRSLLPRANAGRVGWLVTALLPAAAVAGVFLLRPLPRPAEGVAPRRRRSRPPRPPCRRSRSPCCPSRTSATTRPTVISPTACRTRSSPTWPR